MNVYFSLCRLLTENPPARASIIEKLFWCGVFIHCLLSSVTLISILHVLILFCYHWINIDINGDHFFPRAFSLWFNELKMKKKCKQRLMKKKRFISSIFRSVCVFFSSYNYHVQFNPVKFGEIFSGDCVFHYGALIAVTQHTQCQSGCYFQIDFFSCCFFSLIE